MSKKYYYKVNYDSVNFNNLESENLDQFLEGANIERVLKAKEIVKIAHDIFNLVGINTAELRVETELALKLSIREYVDTYVHSVLRRFFLSGDEAELKKLIKAENFDFFLNYPDAHSLTIVNPDSTISADKEKIINSVYSYFYYLHPRPLFDQFMQEFILETIDSNKSNINPSYKVIYLAVKWAALSLMVMSGAIDDCALDEAHVCLSRAVGFLDSYNLVYADKSLSVITQMNDQQRSAFNSIMKAREKENRERDVFTRIIEKILIDSNFKIKDSFMFDVIFNTKPSVIDGDFNFGKVEVNEGLASGVYTVSYGSAKYDKKGITQKTKKIRERLCFS